jgi:hypothetical protein
VKVATTSLQTRVHYAPVLAPDVAGGGSDRAAPWLLWHSMKHQVLLRTKSSDSLTGGAHRACLWHLRSAMHPHDWPQGSGGTWSDSLAGSLDGCQS